MALRDQGGISASDIANAAAAHAVGTLTLDVSADVKKSMVDFLSTANRMVSGSQLGKYFADTETLAKRLGETVSSCGKRFRELDDSKAKELVNTFNALNARAGGADISKYFSNFTGGFDRVREAVVKAQGMVGKFVEGFHMEDFNRMFTSYDNIVEWTTALGGSKQTVDELMRSLVQLNGADVNALVTQLTQAKQQITSLNNEITNIKSGAAFTELEAQIADLTAKLQKAQDEVSQVRVKAEQEFTSFLNGNNINENSWDPTNWRLQFEGYFEAIRDGSMTAREAIMQFKEEFGYLLRDQSGKEGGLFSQEQVSQFISKLEEVYAKVEEIGNFIRSAGNNAPGLIAGAAEKDLQNINKVEQSLRHVIDEGGQAGHVGQIVNGVAEAASSGTQKMGEMSEQTVKLVDALTSLGQAGEGSLAAISSIFRNIGTIKDLEVNTDQFKNLKNALEILKDTTGMEKIGLLSNINLQGFSNLKISTTIAHLATYLPPISQNVDVEKLRALSDISLKNFDQNNLKVSKASMEHLRDLIAQIQGMTGRDVFSQYDYGAGQVSTAVAQELQQASDAVRDNGAAVRDNLGNMPQQARTAEAAITGYADKVEAEMQRISKAIEKSFNLDALTAKLKRGDLDIIRQALQTGVTGGDPFAALETLAGSKTQLARTTDYIKTGLGNPVLMELNNVRQQYETFIKYIDNDYSDLYNKFNALALLFKGFSGGKDQLQIRGADLYSKIDTSKIPFASFEEFQAALRGLSINFPGLANYSSTLGLDTLNLSGVEEQSERIRAAAERAVAAKQQEATAVSGVSEALASGTQAANAHTNAAEQNIAAAQKTAVAIRDEKAAVTEGNKAKEGDAAAAQLAAKAEADKQKVSELLTGALKREQEATKGAGDASEQAAKQESQYVNTTMKRVFDMQRSIEDARNSLGKLTDGKSRPEYKTYGELIVTLEEVIQKYYKYQEVLAANPDDTKAAAQVLSIKDVWGQIADVAMKFAEARESVNSFTHKTKDGMKDADRAAREFLQDVNALMQVTSKNNWGVYAEKLKSIERSFKGVQNPSEELREKMEKLRDILTTLSDAKAAPEAKLQAYGALKSAVEGVNLAIRNEANAERDAAKSQRELESSASGAAKEVERLNNVFASLRDKSKFDTASFEKMRDLLAQANDTSLPTDQRQAALQRLNDLIKQTSDSLRQLTAAEKAEAAAKKTTEDADKQKASLIKQLNNLLNQCTAAEQKYAIVSKAAFARENYKGIQDTKAFVQQLLQQLNGANPKLAEIARGAREAQTSFSNFNTALKTSGGLINRYFTTGMSQLKSRLTYTFGLAAMVYKAVAEIKKMISVAVELDSAMNTLQIVTRSSGAEMEAYGKRVSSMAKETAQATKDLIDATTVYARLGYSMDESAILSKYTAMLEGVGGIEASAAQDAITAIIKAFGKNVNEIEDVMDKLVLVGNNFPISVSQLAEGMNNAGSMLAVAGNSFEQSIALLTAANTTIQNISKASTGLRTIAARIRKTNTGEEDGEIVEESKYQEMVNALTKQHVSLIDEVTGQYRSTYDIIRDIASVWKDMTSMEQAAVVEALAGTRQQNIFASLMTQFGEAEDAMERMGNSAGELQESYDIYLGSIQAHVQTLKAAFDELSVDFLDSGFAKGAIDALTKIVEALDWVISKIGMFGTIIAAVGLPIIARNFEKIAVAVSKVFKAIFLSKGWDGLLVMSTAADKLSVVLTRLASVAPVLVPLLAAFATAAVAAKVIDGKSFESASAQVAQTKAELDKLEEQQNQVVTKWNELNDAKARGDFTLQQETELTLLNAQKDALQAQVDLLKDRYELEKAHERDTARAAVGRLLADAGDRNGYSTAQAVAAYRDAKQQYNKGNIFGKKSAGAKNNLDAAAKILEGQLQTYQSALKVLDPEEDAELIAQIKDDILEITSAVSDIPIEVLRARSELEKIQQGGKVKLLNRPVIDANILEAAGWGEFKDGEDAAAFSSTYSNEDETVAMNFTPIIVDKDGNYVGAFTPEQLQQYAEAVIAGTREDTLGLKIGATFEGPDAIKQATAEAEKVHELHELVYEQDLKKIRKFHNDVKTLSNGTLNAIKKYVKDGTDLTKEQAKELQDFLDHTKYSGEEFARMFSQMFAEAPDGLSTTIEKSIADLAGFHDEIDEINKAFETFERHMEGGEKDDAIKKAADIYKGVLEDIQTDRIDTNRLHAAAELLLGKDVLKRLHYNVEAVAKELQGSVWQYLFDPNEESELDYGQRFAEYVRQNFTKDSGVWVEDGNTFLYKNLQSVADAFNMSKDAAAMFISALDIYGVNVMRSVDDTEELISRFYTLKNSLGGASEAVAQIVNELHTDGYDDFEIYTVLDQLQQAGVIDLDRDQLYTSIDEALGKIKELDQTEAEPTTDMNYEPFTLSYNAVVDMMNNLNSMTASPTVTMDFVPGETPGTDTKSNSKSTNNTQSAAGTYSKAGAGGKQPGRNGGDTLVNELGPELISDKGRAFIANGGRPGFVRLSDDAIVFTAEETKDILHGKRNVNGKALAQGNVGRGSLIGRLIHKGTPAKAYKYCPECGASNSVTATRCSRCGSTFLVNRDDAPTSGTWTCAFCGARNLSWQGSCYNCGHGRYESPTQYTNPTDEGPWWIETDYTDPESVAAAEALRKAQEEYRRLLEQQRIQKIRDAREEAEKAAGQGYGTTPKNSSLGKSLTGTGGGNHVGGADYQSAADPQKVDWVAVRINRIQRAIADLEKVATSGFKMLETRLQAARDQISRTTDEIKVMEQAYDRYIQEANSVGLSDSIATLVREGEIDITKYDDDTRKKIDEYTEWYEKALDAKSALEELHQNIAQLYVDSFEMVQTDFENQLAQIEHSANMTSKNLEMAQKRGYLDSASFYEELASNQSEQINRLNMELAELNQKFKEAMDSGEIEENSEAWYEMKSSINEVEEALADANIQLVDYQRTIRQLDWSNFDYAHERLAQMNEEATFFIDLMGHHELFQDNGQFNNLGEATAGLHAVNYDMYMVQAEEYAKEIQKIQHDLEQDPYDTELIERREELLGLQRQSITAAEQEKEAVKSLVQEGINKELEALRDLVDTYEKNLDSAKDLYEYQKKISEKTADLASIQKQLSAYQNDTSEETRAKVQKLQNDLKKGEQELRETEWEQSISDQKKLLDDMMQEYEDYLNARLDNIDLLMQEMIVGTNENMDEIRSTLIEVGDEVGYTMTDQLTQALSENLNYYDHMFESMNSVHGVLTSIYDMVAAMARASGAVKAYATGGLVDYTGLAAVHGSKARPELMLNANDTENFLEAAKWMRVALSGPSFSGLAEFGSGTGGGGIGQLIVNIPIERVQDYNDFVRQLQSDPKFERLISAMTLDRTVGKSAFGKNRIVF